jgi:hypothetical protein
MRAKTLRQAGHLGNRLDVRAEALQSGDVITSGGRSPVNGFQDKDMGAWPAAQKGNRDPQLDGDPGLALTGEL